MASSFSTLHILIFIGFLVMGLILFFGFKRLFSLQKDQIKRIESSDKDLQKREKLVMASEFASELTENKFKCEAFITIYAELLHNLRDTERRALYEDTGDFVHQHAPLNRTVFEKYVDQLQIFGPKLAGDLARTYAAVRPDPQYFTLEPNMPRASATRVVEMVLDDAHKTLEPMDAVIAALNVIIRDGAKVKTEGRQDG